MTIHKLTAGHGYSYLTRQVAALDATERGHTGLADYYSQRGESPGQWLGSALGDVDLQDGQEVTAAQMAALFGEGKHPNADAITEQVMDKRAGGSGRLQDVQDAIRLGAPFAVIDSAPAFRVAVAKACAQVNAGLGMPHDWPLPAAERARVRTANRDTWTVTGLRTDGSAVVAGSRGERVLPAAYVRHQVELAYASTIYGAQGATTDAAHPLVGEHTGAAGAYVAMTRGRDHNTAHLVADTVQAAREQWIEVFSQDRADLGPAHAARLAAQEAAQYATHRPQAVALSDLRDAWTQEHALAQHLTTARHERDQLTQVVALRAQHDAQVAAGQATSDQERARATRAAEHANQLGALVGNDTFQLAGRLHQEWDTGRPGARVAAQTIRAGTGRIGQHRGAVRRASQHLQVWAERWRPIVASLPTDTSELVVLAACYDDPKLGQTITAYARKVAEEAHPDHTPARAAAQTARHAAKQTLDAYDQTCTHYPAQLAGHGNLAYLPDPARHLAQSERDVAELTDQLQAAHAWVRATLTEPALRSLPQERIETETRTLGNRPPREGSGGAQGQCRPRRRTLPDHRAPARTIRGALRTQAQPRDQPLSSRRSRLRNDCRGPERLPRFSPLEKYRTKSAMPDDNQKRQRPDVHPGDRTALSTSI